MASKKKTTIQSKDLFYRSPCPIIDQILSIRRLSSKEATDLYTKLKDYVKNLPKEGAIFSYIRMLVKELLIDPDCITPYLSEESIPIVLKEVYECIVEIYIAFRIEFICADLNNLPPDIGHLPPDIRNIDPNSWPDHAHGGKSAKSPKDEADLLIDHIMKQAAATATSATVSKKKKQKETFFLNANDLKLLQDSLAKSVIGQDQAIESLVNRLKLISVGFDKRGVFFFIGRTGVGKTELARLFGKRYCGNFAKINCAEFSNGHEIAKLIGAPPGYVGSAQTSFFKEKAEISNRWVFLFDEIEKANEKLFNLLLSLLDDGTITDSTGNALDFSNSIFIFTSNQGISDIKETSLGFGSKGPSQDAINTTLKDSLGRKFSPEFRNRIDEFIYFNDLTPENVAQIVRLNLKSYNVEITDELVNYVVKNSYSNEFGVREVKRFIKNSIGLFVANAILDGIIPITGTKYKLSVKDNKLEVQDTIQIPIKAKAIS